MNEKVETALPELMKEVLENMRAGGEMASLPELLSTGKVAGMLDAGQRSVWRWSHAGVMPPPVKIGAAVRFRRDEILAWIAQGCPPCEEGAAQ
jgi:predicted DNA-binding transcriptional regulator AlpA